MKIGWSQFVESSVRRPRPPGVCPGHAGGMSFPAAAAVFQGEGRTPVVTEHSSSSESAPIGDRVEGILERQGGKRFKAALGGNSPVTGSPLESPDAALEVAGADVVAPGQFRVPRSVHLVWPPEMREVISTIRPLPSGSDSVLSPVLSHLCEIIESQSREIAILRGSASVVSPPAASAPPAQEIVPVMAAPEQRVTS